MNKNKKEAGKMKEFHNMFNFKPEGKMLVGVERETFLTTKDGIIAPIVDKVLNVLGIGSHFSYELSACQLEDRVGPVVLSKLKNELLRNEKEIMRAESSVGFKRIYCEVAPYDMPLDIYPDPTGRYKQITKDMPIEILRAACRVIGTHIHIGMPDHDTAIIVYNQVIRRLVELCEIGNKSEWERLKIYKIMAPDFIPPRYESWKDFYYEAVKSNFLQDPRKCWHLIRLSVHGTIEFRMFGVTPNINEVVDWATICHNLCLEALEN
jgi:gamma-glutamyl:cysteine ligase YbdK (ATP-grasp superfamily)